MSYCIDATESLGEGLRRIALEQTTAAIADMSIPGPDPGDQIHDFRRRCKKLRALFRLIQPLITEQFAQADAEVRAASSKLGHARDKAVIGRTLQAVAADNVTAEGNILSIGVDGEVAGECTEIMQAVRGRVDAWPLEDCSAAEIRKGFEETYRNLQSELMRASAEPTNWQYHEVRKWAKYHWYQLQLLLHVGPESFAERSEKLRRIGEELGDAHDIAVLLDGETDHRELSEDTKRRLGDRNAALLQSAALRLRDLTRADPQTLGRDLERRLANLSS